MSTNPWAQTFERKPEDSAALLLTFDQTAALLQVCKRTVERLVERGELPVVRVGRMPRIRRADLLGWIEQAAQVVTKPKHKQD